MPSAATKLAVAGHIYWALLIIFSAFAAVPVLVLLGMRFQRRSHKISRKKMTTLVILLSVVFLVLGFGFNFGSMLVFWLFLPLSIIYTILLMMCPPLAIIIIPVYMYLFLKLLLLFNGRIFWKQSSKGKRLYRMKRHRLV
jgi:ammonia channel protein AmtB